MARITKEKQAEIRKAIINASRNYFYNNGFEKTSTKSIAKAVGIAEGTLFNYFDSKADLFIEVIKEDYVIHQPDEYDINNMGEHISDGITAYIFKTINFMIKLPKSITVEMLVAAIKMGRKNPDKFKKLAELDFQYMDKLKKFFDSLADKGIIKCDDTKEMSEIIFGVLMFELTMFLYDKDISRDIFKSRLEHKIRLIMAGIIQGGSNEY